MKTSVIITALLFTQVSASFFDVFQGAVLSVQNSFGKLLSDVVTDVKDTVDCTILAVEHVLSLSEDATIRYYDKCGQRTNQTILQNDPKQNESLPKVEVSIKFPDSEEYLQKVIPAEIDARINQTLSKVLGDYKPNNNLLSIENILAKESEQLTDVSDLVKKEMKKLTSEVTTDLEHIKQRDSGPSVDAILKEIKVLEKKEKNARNPSEAIEIHQVIDEVLDKLGAIEATEANESDKLEEILRDLENNSNNSFLGLRQQFKEWKEEESRHLSEIKDKIEQHEKIYNNSNKMYDANHTQSIILIKDKQNDTSEPVILSQGILKVQRTKAEESLDITRRRISTTDVTENSYGSGFTQDFKSTTADETNESVTTNQSPSTPTNNFRINDQFLNENNSKKLPITTSVPTLETLTIFDKQNVTATTASTQNLDPNDITSTSNHINHPPIIETTIDSKATEHIETSTASGREYLATVMDTMNKSTDSNNTDAVTENIVENVTSQYTEGVVGSTTEVFVRTTKMITTEANVNDSSNILVISTPAPISTSESIETIVTTTTASLFEEPATLISNKSLISNISGNSSSIESTTISEVLVLADNSPSESDQPSKLTTYTPITDVKTTTTVNEEPSTGTDTTTPVQTPESSEIQPIKNTTRNIEEEPSHKAITLDIDSNASLITSTHKITDIMATTNEETTTLKTEIVSEKIEPTMTTPIIINEEFSTLTLSDSDYNTNGLTSTLPPAAENTLSTAMNQPEESTPSVENDEPALSEDNNLDHIATSAEFTSAITETTTENIKTIETTIVSETQEPTHLTMNDTLPSSTLSPPKENLSLTDIISIESTTASKIEKGLLIRDEMVPTTPKIIINHNFTINSPPLTVTGGPPIINKVPLIDQPMIPVNKQWLTPRSVDKATSNKIVQPNYNIPRAPKVNNDFPQSLTDGLLNPRWPLYDPHQVNSPQKFDSIAVAKGTFSPQLQNPVLPDYHGRKNDFRNNRFSDIGTIPVPMNPKVLNPGLIPTVPKQQPQAEISAHDQALLDVLDSMDDSGWPLSSMDDIFKLAEVPIAPEIKNTPSPRVPLDRGRMNTPERPLQLPYNRYRPPGLTTYRPPSKARKDDNQNIPLDYDSFFHIPQKNSEAHHRALKDAQQLIANSQLSNRIIDRVLQSKNNVGVRSIFNNPRTLNSGK